MIWPILHSLCQLQPPAFCLFQAVVVFTRSNHVPTREFDHLNHLSAESIWILVNSSGNKLVDLYRTERFAGFFSRCTVSHRAD